MQYSTINHTLHEIEEKNSEYCIVLPVLNEGERIHSQLERMRPHCEGIDILICDGNSHDNSMNVERLKSKKVSALLVKKDVGGLSSQMRLAMAYALDRGYQGLVFMDGNNKDDPAAIPQFVELLRKGYDHIQGSRYIEGGAGINTPVSRKYAVQMIHAPLIRLSSGFKYTDTTNGFRGYSAKFLADERVQPLRDVFQFYELHYYLAIQAARLGFRVIETPVTRAYPTKGKTPTKISPLTGNMSVLKALFKACAGVYNP
jgi:dolichol-phosphate mannosyltransferase